MQRILDVINAPWAITPDMLDTIAGVYDAYLRGDSADLAQFEARYQAEQEAAQGREKPYDVIDGVAVIPIHGVMAKRANLFHMISGGCSHQMVGAMFDEAMNDRDVKNIVLDIETPGGTVDGTSELAQKIYNARSGDKQIVTVADGLMASAGYWVGSAAHKIVITSSTTDVGSIGVVATHADYSENDKMRGIKRTEIYAGQYKRIVSDTKPLDAAGTTYLQERVDYLYSLFLGSVAKHLGSTPQAVHEQQADGRIFTGQQAIDVGLASDVMSLDEVIEQLNHSKPFSLSNPRATAAQSTRERPAMDKATIEQEHPEIAAAIRADGFNEGHTAGLTEGKTAGQNEAREAALAEGEKAGADKERARIQAVENQSMGGHEELIGTLKFDGVTTGPEAAVKVLEAEKAAIAKAKGDFEGDAPNAQQSAPSTGAEDDAPALDANVLAKRAGELVDEAHAKGQRLSYAQAVAQAKKELS